MDDNVLRLIFLVDLSSSDNSTIASINENVREIIYELQDQIHTLSLVVFSNIPKIISEKLDYSDFDIQLQSLDLGGMCNVHYALNTAAQLFDESSDIISCILLFSTSDPTDTDRLLNEDTKRLLSDSEKYLIKKSSALLEPTGFDGSRTYTLGDGKQIERLIRDIRDLCNASDTDLSEQDSGSQDIEAPEMKDKVEHTFYSEDEDLPSPDIYK